MSRRHLLILLLLGAIWGASFLFIRVAVPQFGPVPLVELRVAIAALFLAGLLASRGRGAALRGHWARFALVGAFTTAIPFCLFAFATLSVHAGFAAMLNGTSPLFGAAVGLAWFGETLDRRRAAGLTLGFAGVVVFVWQDISVPGNPLAIAAGLAAALCYGLGAHLAKRKLGGVDPLAVAAGSQAASALMLLVPAIASWPAQAPTPTGWAAALTLGLLCTGIANGLYFRLVADVGPTRTMMVAYLIPVFGMLWGALFLHEAITPTMAIGGTIILAGVALTTWRRAAPAPAAAPAMPAPERARA